MLAVLGGSAVGQIQPYVYNHTTGIIFGIYSVWMGRRSSAALKVSSKRTSSDAKCRHSFLNQPTMQHPLSSFNNMKSRIVNTGTHQ
jgi:hypothetical protein